MFSMRLDSKFNMCSALRTSLIPFISLSVVSTLKTTSERMSRSVVSAGNCTQLSSTLAVLIKKSEKNQPLRMMRYEQNILRIHRTGVIMPFFKQEMESSPITQLTHFPYVNHSERVVRGGNETIEQNETPSNLAGNEISYSSINIHGIALSSFISFLENVIPVHASQQDCSENPVISSNSRTSRVTPQMRIALRQRMVCIQKEYEMKVKAKAKANIHSLEGIEEEEEDVTHSSSSSSSISTLTEQSQSEGVFIDLPDSDEMKTESDPFDREEILQNEDLMKGKGMDWWSWLDHPHSNHSSLSSSDDQTISQEQFVQAFHRFVDKMMADDYSNSIDSSPSPISSEEDLPHYMRGTRAVKNQYPSHPDRAIHRQQMRKQSAEAIANKRNTTKYHSNYSVDHSFKSNHTQPQIDYRKALRESYEQVMERRAAERQARNLQKQKQKQKQPLHTIPRYMQGTKAVPGWYNPLPSN